MKKYLGLLIVLIMVLVVNVSAVRAEDDNTSGAVPDTNRSPIKDVLKTSREGFRSEIEIKREAFREKIQMERKTFAENLKKEREVFKAELKAKREEFRKSSEEKKVEFCGKAKEMIAKRFESAITQLEKLQTRAGEIIEKLGSEGKDTTLATEALNLSKEKLALAKSKLLEIKVLVPDSCKNVTPENFEKVKLGAREAKDLLKESRESLHQAIKEIKTLRGENKNKGTETGDKNEETQ